MGSPHLFILVGLPEPALLITYHLFILVGLLKSALLITYHEDGLATMGLRSASTAVKNFAAGVLTVAVLPWFSIRKGGS